MDNPGFHRKAAHRKGKKCVSSVWYTRTFNSFVIASATFWCHGRRAALKGSQCTFRLLGFPNPKFLAHFSASSSNRLVLSFSWRAAFTVRCTRPLLLVPKCEKHFRVSQPSRRCSLVKHSSYSLSGSLLPINWSEFVIISLFMDEFITLLVHW